MTKRESEIIRKAIGDLMADDGDFSGAISSLGALVGLRYPAEEVRKDLKPVNVWDIDRRESRPFSVKGFEMED